MLKLFKQFVSALGLEAIFSTTDPDGNPATLGEEAARILRDNFTKIENAINTKADNGGSAKSAQDLDNDIQKITDNYLAYDTGYVPNNIIATSWVQGSVNSSGVEDTALNRIKTTFTALPAIKVIALSAISGYRYSVVWYANNDTASFIRSDGNMTEAMILIAPTNANYFKVVLSKIDNSNLTPSSSTNISVKNVIEDNVPVRAASKQSVEEIETQVTTLSTNVDDIKNNYLALSDEVTGNTIPLTSWTQGSISGSGVEDTQLTRIKSVAYTPVPASKKIVVFLSSGYAGSVVLYSAGNSGSFLRSIPITSGAIIVLNSNENFFRSVLRRSDNSELPTSESVNVTIKEILGGGLPVRAASKQSFDAFSTKYDVSTIPFTTDKGLYSSGLINSSFPGFSVTNFIPVGNIKRVILSGDYVFNNTVSVWPAHGYFANVEGAESILKGSYVYAGDKLYIDLPLTPEVQYIRFFLPTNKISVTNIWLVDEKSAYTIASDAIKTQLTKFEKLGSIFQYEVPAGKKELLNWTNRFKQIQLSDGDVDRSFPQIAQKGEKIILTYVRRDNHVATGQTVFRTSVDFGETFTDEILLSTELYGIFGAYRIKQGIPQNRVVFAEIQLDRTEASGYFERTRVNYGDFDTLFNSNLSSGITVGSFLNIPPNSGAGLTQSEPVASAVIIEHNNVLYLCGYDNQQNHTVTNSRSWLCKSTDWGQTWQFVSSLPTYSGENAIEFVGERMIMCSRVGFGKNLSTENNKISYSDDYGATWNTKTMTGYNVHNVRLFVYDGGLYLIGRHRLNERVNLGLFYLNENLDIVNGAIVAYNTTMVANNDPVPSYHQAILIVNDKLRIFSHNYTTPDQAKSYIFKIDIPLYELINLKANI